MNTNAKLNTYLWSALVAAIITLVGCERKNEPKPVEQQASNVAWTNMLSQYRGTILTGSWVQAETYWNELHYRINPASCTKDEANQWVQFQIEFLQKTGADPYRDEIRICSIQELGNFPEVSHVYLAWLKEGLATNLFVDKAETQKAREVIAELELNNRTNK